MFDVISHFTSVPLQQFFEILAIILTNKELPIPINSFIQLIEICM